MNSERSVPALDLHECCDGFALRVTKIDGKCHIECPRCHAHTSPDTPECARAQWVAMKEAQRAMQPKPKLTLPARKAVGT